MQANPTQSAALRYIFRLSLFATLLAFIVVVLGAYTRLTDAGLGCPDWPQCYGKWIVSPSTIGANADIHIGKAWTEMIHRYMAGILSLTIFALVILIFRHRHIIKQPLILPCMLLILIMLQALLGMWTVTLKLLPLVVMAHLLGGLTTLALLGWLTLKLAPLPQNCIPIKKIKILRIGGALGFIALVVQLFLGGWTSANYAALVCLDFPFCHNTGWIDLDFTKAFNFMSAGVTGSTGEPLDIVARITIHMLHRIHALLTTAIIGFLVFFTFLYRTFIPIYISSLIMLGLLILQVILGVTNVLALLPLPIAVLHNAVAALLLLAIMAFNYYLYWHPRDYSYGYGKISTL